MSKKWTVVIEVNDDTNISERKHIDQLLTGILQACIPISMSFQIFEITEAPYGPQVDGVILAEVKPGRAGRITTATESPKCPYCNSYKLLPFDKNGYGINFQHASYFRCDDCRKQFDAAVQS